MQDNQELDKLVQEHTGFESWAEMKQQMDDHGYVPLVVDEYFANKLHQMGYQTTQLCGMLV
jgi:hypothetical protein